jgi:hypothetical protein
MKKLDWIDIGLHAAVAVLVVLLGHYGLGLPLFALCLASAIVWPGRELWQHRPNYLEIITHEQPLLEWLAPVLVSVITALLILWGAKA